MPKIPPDFLFCARQRIIEKTFFAKKGFATPERLTQFLQSRRMGGIVLLVLSLFALKLILSLYDRLKKRIKHQKRHGFCPCFFRPRKNFLVQKHPLTPPLFEHTDHHSEKFLLTHSAYILYNKRTTPTESDTLRAFKSKTQMKIIEWRIP